MRTRGTGSIGKVKYKDAAGKVQLSPFWYIWYRKAGRTVKESSGSETKMVAEKLLNRRLEETGLGIQSVKEKNLKYEAVRDTLLNEYAIKGHATLVTKADGTKTIWGLNHLNDFFCGRPVAGITTGLLREFVAKRQADGAENGTINRNMALLRRMFYLAKREGKISAVPYFPMLKPGDPRQGFLEPEQFEKLLAAMPKHLHPLMLFLYFTGCRVGAALKIQWSQIVFNGKKVEVRMEAAQVKNRTAMTLPLPDSLAKILRKQFRTDGPVFSDTNLRKAFHSAAVQVGLGTWRDPKNHDAGYDGLIPHDLRRSGVRNLVRAGVSETIAMTISGHKTRHIFQRYNITSSADIHDAMAKVEKLVAKN